MILAIGWPWNTGKTHTTEILKKKFNYKVYKETARDLFSVLEKKWMEVFQKAIYEKEIEKLKELQKLKWKENIVVDRTFSDHIVYKYYNIIKWLIKDHDLWDIQKYIEISKEVYDKVILFTEPLKESKRFKEYNNKELNELLIATIKTIYKGKVEEYKNSLFYIYKNN